MLGNRIKNLAVIFLMSVLCGCGGNESGQVGESIVVIDTDKNYPTLDLKLRDIATVSYVPLDSSHPLVNGSVTDRIFITDDLMILGDANMQDPKLMAFDRNGNYKYQIGSSGRGPGEYGGWFDFFVDTLDNEITLWDYESQKIIVYDINGTYKYDKRIDLPGDGKIREIKMLDERYIIGLNPRSQYIYEKTLWGKGRETVFAIDRTSLTVNDSLHYPIFKRPDSDEGISLAISNMARSSDGVYISSLRSDTIYLINKDLQAIPKFVDITSYGTEDVGLHVALETDKYVFLCTDMKQNVNKDYKFFVYDKKLKRVFRLDNGTSGKESSAEFALLQNKAIFNTWSRSLNLDYAVTQYWPQFLNDYHDLLDDELQKLAKTRGEYDNPILMLIKFK